MDNRGKKKIFFYRVGGVLLSFIAVILIFREFFPEYLGEAIYSWAAIAILIAALKEMSKRKKS
ncbi:MAG: hypothetical protein JAY97_11610 [Candidatus Thiodiazotropha sp. 'RUGA']|nr:hypothetical protein [Candidatus Thiodiazotropha sp. 'RUGA']